MAEEQPKPRKVKDLKARLGRTISPVGRGGVGAPGAEGAADASAGGDGPIPPPAAISPPGGGIGLGGRGVVAPPFMQKAQKKPASDDPFAAGEGPTGPREVRLVIDDSAVAASEVGRQGRRGLIVAVFASAIISIAVGYGVGSAMSGRQQHNSAIQSARRIHEAVSGAEAALSQVEEHLEKAMTAGRAGPGKSPSVDQEAIAALRAIENPFQAATFSRDVHPMFNAATVESIFQFHTKTREIFEQIRVLGNRVAARGPEIAAAIQAAQELTSEQTGCIPTVENGVVLCSLVFVDPPREGSNMLAVRATKATRPAEREIYVDQNIRENPDKFVILTNSQRSIGVLGQRASAFAEYTRDLALLKSTLDEALEARGQLRGQLDQIRTMSELTTF